MPRFQAMEPQFRFVIYLEPFRPEITGRRHFFEGVERLSQLVRGKKVTHQMPARHVRISHKIRTPAFPTPPYT